MHPSRTIRDVKWAADIGRGGARPARFRLFDHGDGRHDLARGTETALEAVVFDERCLNRVKSAVALQPFNRGDALAVLHRGQRHTGENAATVDMNGACAAFPAIARLLRP